MTVEELLDVSKFEDDNVDAEDVGGIDILVMLDFEVLIEVLMEEVGAVALLAVLASLITYLPMPC